MGKTFVGVVNMIAGREAFALAKSRRHAVSASAVFLIAFLLVHVAGNLTIFISTEAFNFYGHKLHQSRVLLIVEVYLAAGFSVHVVMAILLTIKDKKYTWPRNKLIASGLLLLLFVVTHVQTFRFGEYYETVVHGVVVRDIAKVQVKVFSDIKVVAWYVFTAVVLGLHLLWGWKKTVRKPHLGIPKDAIHAAELLGTTLTYLIIIGFCACPLYTYMAFSHGGV